MVEEDRWRGVVAAVVAEVEAEAEEAEEEVEQDSGNGAVGEGNGRVGRRHNYATAVRTPPRLPDIPNPIPCTRMHPLSRTDPIPPLFSLGWYLQLPLQSSVHPVPRFKPFLQTPCPAASQPLSQSVSQSPRCGTLVSMSRRRKLQPMSTPHMSASRCR